MKKVLFLVAVATLALLSCQKENVKNDVKNSITFTAIIDDFNTKADMNNSNQLVWSAGDKIGIYVNGWDANSNQSFTLKGDGGTTTGSFGRTSEDWFETDQAKAAFFPWTSENATTIDSNADNNVYGDKVYFHLPGFYESYTSGKMITPLVAPVVWNGSAYAPISFKHAGAAVKVTINNLPAMAHSIGMTADQQIFGSYEIAVADAGNATLTPNNTGADSGNKTIWLNYATDFADRLFTFIFPVPALTNPKLSFVIYDKNGVVIWRKNLKAQPVSIAHGDVLNMPAISINQYERFSSIGTLGLRGKINGTEDWANSLPMITDGDACIAKGITFLVNDEFKITDGSTWYPSGDNYKVDTAGTYDVLFFQNDGSIKLVPTGECPYPAASGIGKGNDLGDPSVVTGTIF